MSLSVGARLGPYEILSTLGRGGMGEVYRARHVKLARDVAIKVLPEDVASNRERLARFEREARLASSLNHLNIITIYDIADYDGTTFIAMELVDGKTLRQIIREGTIPVDRAIDIAIQLGEGLSRAHAAGIVHRDLKPENVMIAADGVVKILDFGLAKDVSPPEVAEESTAIKTAPEVFVAGTPRYMSPEQIGHGVIDGRSDQFAFGIVLFEMLAGVPPFDGRSMGSIITAISHDPPAPLEPLRREVPSDLAKLVRRCLAKDPNDRFATTEDLCRALRKIKTRRARRPVLRALAAATASALLIALLGTWMWFRGAERRWAEHDAVPQIAGMIDRGDVFEAYRLALRAERYTPKRPDLERLLGRITFPRKIVTVPAGAEVEIKGYGTPQAPWEVLGITPLNTRVPYALVRMRISKKGYEPFEGAPIGGGVFGAMARGLNLAPARSSPAGTVRVFSGNFRGGPLRLELPGGVSSLPVGEYWIDRYEITNREFKRFVDAGGYRDQKYWIDGFSGKDTETKWADTTRSFRDATGRPGPATWNLGTYPDGADDLPVGGVSWYEAAAYCRYAGKTLPTIYHWFSAVGQEQLSDILRLSNFNGEGPAPVGTYQGLGGYGTYDMAGNVKEWCWNATTAGNRYILGGAWNDPAYMFRHIESRPPLERLPTHGIRCAVYRERPRDVLFAPIDPLLKISTTPPVSEEVYEAYRGMYTYDRTELRPKIEKVDNGSPYWRKEVVSFDAAYGGERMRALLFLPRNAKPPYQTVLWFPGDDVFAFRSSETLASSYLFDFIPRSGRALVYPIYDGMYERWKPFEKHPNEQRDRMIRWSKDLRRTIDYLETRSDIDPRRLAYYGLSGGASNGPIFTAVEPRIRASVLLGGGLLGQAKRPEVDPGHFAPRCHVPTLLINGVDDFIFPYEAQKAMLDALGVPPGQKRLARLEGGHIPSNRLDIIRETLDWLDRWLGPVENADGAKLAAKR